VVYFLKEKREKERYAITQARAQSRFAEQPEGLDLDREIACVIIQNLYSLFY
jgi:hypothetical protein